jgi:hypothetical protein
VGAGGSGAAFDFVDTGGRPMNRISRVLPWLAAVMLVAGCGFDGGRDARELAPAVDGDSLLADARSLPDGHPPIPGGSLGLPKGHPPLRLPEGHPPLPGDPSRCPRSASGPGWQPDEGAVLPSEQVELIST